MTGPGLSMLAADVSEAMQPTLAIVDYGMGNRRSVEKAFEHIGAQAILTSDKQKIADADGLVICGVGAFVAGIEALNADGLGDLVKDRVADGIPLLGICLGMQLLFDTSDERGGAKGLGLIPGAVKLLEPEGEKLPHIGWNVVRWTRDAQLRGQLGATTPFYHVHSYAASPTDADDITAVGDYGGEFVSAVQRGNVHGAQFHPEKSSTDGLHVLSSFAAACVRSAN